jgi:hypothetical protein
MDEAMVRSINPGEEADILPVLHRSLEVVEGRRGHGDVRDERVGVRRGRTPDDLAVTHGVIPEHIAQSALRSQNGKLGFAPPNV